MTNPSYDIVRERLHVTATPIEVLRRLRGRERLVALIGAWHHGEALIACEPSRLLSDFMDVDLPHPNPQSDAFGGGWIGSWGYRLGLPADLAGEQARPVPQDELRVGFYDIVLRQVSGAWWLESLGEPDPSIRASLLAALDAEAPAREFSVTGFEPVPAPSEHIAAVEKTLDRIRDGEISQVNLCMRLDAQYTGDPLDAFCAGVEKLKPAYAAFVSAPGSALVSFSPELFLRRTGTTVLTSPIKGTAPLETDPAELLASAKNRSENIIAVDLLRGDLAQIAVPGTVRIGSLTRLEKHSVWHLVSDIVADLAQETGDGEVLAAMFPPGSVTGAPKQQSLRVIAELEATGREAYTGAIGHISPHAGMELNVAIRTFEFAAAGDGHWRVWIGVGGGIGTGSDPADEFAECLVKAAPLVDAIGGSLAVNAEKPTGPTDLKTRPTPRTPHADPSQGVFETLLVVDGRPQYLADHISRLDASTRALWGVSVRAGLSAAVKRKSRANPADHRLRIRAVPNGDDVAIELESAPLGASKQSWRLVPRVLAGGMGEHKWVDRRLLAAEPGYEPLLIDEDGTILETARGSLFLVLDDGLHTPQLDGRILPGTARARVIESALKLGIPVHQRNLTTADLSAANEVFACNALRGIVPIISCEGVGRWTPGPMAQLIVSESEAGEASGDRAFDETSRVLLIDNGDSFIYSLAHVATRFGAKTQIVANSIDLSSVRDLIEAQSVTHLIIGPGPAVLANAGASPTIVKAFAGRLPILGVGFGHHVIASEFGGQLGAAAEPVHGRASLIHHDATGLFAGLASPLLAGRYDSRVVTESGELVVTAHTGDGTIMGLRHPQFDVHAVQFHPESLLTGHGDQLIANFLTLNNDSRGV